ncbi:MAG: acyl-CoA dehydrogenase family protein [Meiothermus sp.]|uniref:acyl-CoA dehydrogenase family protein n=1 Tax=Meiothermus sp. TaxID=1955249 RepID=UPI0025FF08DE|nr:acyl-CoA dehydrogenase family protein [Meiothermus sp.]MCS7069628.1 acyl-CoA dehydrogenase family protein [Meiothermus sp.]MDW8426501.1 acyl-CoA dehydrogenase family protein [Meiothermus sp.]
MTAQTADLVGEVRTFVQEEILPLESTFLKHGFRAVLPSLQSVRQKVKARGWWLPPLPQPLGLGLSLGAFARLSEELGRSPLGHYAFNTQAPDIGNMEVLLKHGTPEQKERFLKPLAAGEIRSSFGMTEPEYPGSNPVWMNTTAVLEGDEWVINGHKWFTTGFEGSAFCIVMCLTDPEHPNPYARASQIIVPTETPGLEPVRKISVMGEAGEDWMSHSEIRLNQVRVPRENLLGERGRGFAIAQERLGPGRIHHCMRWIGIAQRSFEMMCQYAAKRELAPGKPLGSRQAIQHLIAEAKAEIHAARLMVLDAAEKVEQQGAEGARVEISLIKYFVAGVLQRVLDGAIQVHGGLGMSDDLPLSFFYRHERAARIYDGADEVHKTVVARAALKEYGLEVSL